MAPYLAPEWLELEKDIGKRIILSGTIENYQAGGNEIKEYIKNHLPPQRENMLMLVDEKINNNISVRIYKPKTSEIALPIGIFYHGGGFSDGSVAMEDGLCRILASACPCIIVSVEYRLVPEVEIRQVFQDAFDGFLWSYENATQLGGDQNKLFTLGSSAGGTLSLAVAHRLIALGHKGKLKGAINMAGGTVCEDHVPKHLQHLMKSMEENSKDTPIIDRETTRMINAFTGLDKLNNDEWMFPLLSSHLAEFPSVYLVACGADPLRDDNVAMEHELRKNGVKVRLDMYEGLPHVFWMFPNLKVTSHFIAQLVSGIRFVLE